MCAQLKRSEMQLRARVPGWIRRLYRVTRAVRSEAVLSKELPAELLGGCELVSSRLALLDHLPKGSTVAEVGTATGAFAGQILVRTQPQSLHVIDVDYSQFSSELAGHPRLTRHEGLSADVLSTFEDATFDWIYIDADHSYDGVLGDARAAAPKLKPGGLLIFNDFAHIDPYLGRYGVHRAVIDFALERGWRLRYFALDPAALYDVALLKP